MSSNSLQIKRSKTAAFTVNTSTHVLKDGELFYNKNNKRLYIGDNSTQLKSLAYLFKTDFDQVATNRSNIATNTSNINTNTQSINTLTSTVGSHTNSIGTMSTSIGNISGALYNSSTGIYSGTSGAIISAEHVVAAINSGGSFVNTNRINNLTTFVNDLIGQAVTGSVSVTADSILVKDSNGNTLVSLDKTNNTATIGSATVIYDSTKTASVLSSGIYKNASFYSNSATAAPFTVVGSGTVTNLNADRLDDYHASDFMRNVTLNGSSNSSPSFYAPTSSGTSGQYLKSAGSGSAPVWGALTLPTITLNGSVNSSPSFYAPTSSGTSGYYLKSNGSGAPTWSSISTPNPTDYYCGNIKITASSSTSKAPTFGAVTCSSLTSLGQVMSGVATGTAPFIVSSSTSVANLNADMLDGYHSSSFQRGSLNGSYMSTNWYAPTAVGTSGYVLKSNGSGAPSWIAQSSLSVGSASSATTATKANQIAVSGTYRTVTFSGGVLSFS